MATKPKTKKKAIKKSPAKTTASAAKPKTLSSVESFKMTMSGY